MSSGEGKNTKTIEALTRVVEKLEEDIVFGHLRPRERLTEDDLINRFGEKRHIVRQALIELEKRNLVNRQHGRGARVYDFKPEEVVELSKLREILESNAARLIPLPASGELIDELTVIHTAHGKAVDDGDLRGIFRANIRFHELLYSACPNRYLVEAVNLYAMKSNVIRFYAGQNLKTFEGSRREHEAIIDALQDGDREKLVALCVDHLHPSSEAYIEAYEKLFGKG